MNKYQLIREISLKANISKEQARRFIEAGIEVITNTLKKGEPVIIKGVAKFEIVKVKARKGRNFKTGESIIIMAKHKVKFRGSPTPH